MPTPSPQNFEAQYPVGLMWFRRDLRLSDNPALHQALTQCRTVHCVFVFDTDILDTLPRADRRVEFIQASLVELDQALRQHGHRPANGLIVLHGKATQRIPELATSLGAQAVFAAHDYEPQALARDDQVQAQLAAQGIALHTCKDHVVFEKREVLTRTGTVYGVFSPYKKAWLARLTEHPLVVRDLPQMSALIAKGLANRPPARQKPPPSLGDIGFVATNLSQLSIPTGESGARQLFEDFLDRMDAYQDARDFPALRGPSYLSVHLRFGTVSIRQLVLSAWQRSLQGSAGASTWLGELIWRDFYAQILANAPQVCTQSFKPEFDAIQWEQGDLALERFEAWKNGQTGYPLVDAAMLQLKQSGYMHNRLRMVAGSFLVKDLGVDWRWGERYFAEQLNDFELSSNNGGWQWVSSSGCDAQPWFRIFNPITQSEKFDAQGKFIKRYLPQLAGLSNRWIHAPWQTPPLELQATGLKLGKEEHYPMPIVQHDQARDATLKRYAVVKKPQI